jgi:2-phospho-L-lactate guanylyltransferase
MELEKITTLIPFKLENPKTRLSGCLSLQERRELAMCMLSDVLSALNELKLRTVVTVPDRETEMACNLFDGVEIVVDERKLDDSVNSFIQNSSPVAIVMADLPLLNSEILLRFFKTEGDVVISPGRKGGTNLLLVRNPEFRVSYHYGSFMKHIRAAETLGLSISVFDSFYASVDIDDESDLLELLIHGKGKKSHDFLISAGFRVDCSEKDPKAIRRYQMDDKKG